MYTQSDLPLIQKRIRAWQLAYRDRVRHLTAAYERPEVIFPDWLLPHPRRLEATVTPRGAGIYAFPAEEDSFSFTWLEGGITEATGGFVVHDGLGELGELWFGPIELIGSDPATGDHTVSRPFPWEQLWVTDRLRSNDLDTAAAVSQADRDVLAFATQHLLGLERQSSGTNPGQAVADELLRLAQEFEALLVKAEREEELQSFLRDNPALLDLRATSVYPKVKLGTEFVTDFVIRLPGDDYVFVEIERSSHPLYTQANNPAAPLTHAVQQVEDWLEWSHDNIAYLRTTLPGIHEPAGLVILGRRSSLNERSMKSLRRRNSTSKIKVITFDDLLDQIRTVATNLANR